MCALLRWKGVAGTPNTAQYNHSHSLPQACTWDASSLTARLYFDGAAVASAQSTGALAAPTSVAVQIGALDGAGGTGRWTGELDELMVWNKTLHPQEAYKLYQGIHQIGAHWLPLLLLLPYLHACLVQSKSPSFAFATPLFTWHRGNGDGWAKAGMGGWVDGSVRIGQAYPCHSGS